MSIKTNLTGQQEQRVRNRQQQKMEQSRGLVLAVHNKMVDVCTLRDNSFKKCYLRSNLGQLVIGDSVIWEEDESTSTSVVVAVQKRKVELKRPVHGTNRVLVANFDRLMIMLAPQPKPSVELLDSLLAISEILNTSVTVLVNKVDLTSARNGIVDELLKPYRDFDYPLLEISALKQKGLDAVKSILDNGISVLAGQSGVGKSTLINVICPNQHAVTGHLNADGHGSHTTTTAQLYPVPHGGWLADLPGVRSFGINNLSTDELATGFREFQPYFGQCQFNNCRHNNEPNCAVKQAVLEGSIHNRRYKQYRLFLNQLTLDSGR